MRACVHFCICAFLAAVPVARLSGQGRVSILQAEDRRAPTAQDVAIIRSGARSADSQTARAAVRALGRLERPALIPDILPALSARLPEVRAEAANAIGQAAQSWKAGNAPSGSLTVDRVASALGTRLRIEADSNVRAALCETIGRLPYTASEQVARAEASLLEMAVPDASIVDKLGVAKGLFWLVRKSLNVRPLSDPARAVLRVLAARDGIDTTGGARVRRLALDALIRAGAVDDGVVERAASDPDTQMRRLAMRAASLGSISENPLLAGLRDESAMVRIEALRGLGARKAGRVCAASTSAAADRNVQVALVALDQLSACASLPDAVLLLDRTASDLATAGAPRSWHRSAHALVALATASPGHAKAALPKFVESGVWQLRLHAARAAALLTDRPSLESLAGDPDDNVREAAIDGLVKVAGHAADAIYVSELVRSGYQVLRAAAIALDGTSQPDAAIAALKAALTRLVDEGRDNSHDAREAIAATLTKLHAAPAPPKGAPSRVSTTTVRVRAEDLRRLAASRARITIRGVGSIDLVLITSEAPATVLRFVHLAESGYYNGLTFHRVAPNFVIQGGSPGANEYIGDASFMRDELGEWPHVRGAVGISTRGRDTGDAQIFIDLVDNPMLDREYTVFAQVLNGLNVVDEILEGDIIEKIEIVHGP